MPFATSTLLAEIMTHAVCSIAPETSLKDAARLMYRMNDLNKYTPHQLKALLDHHPDLVRPGRYKELGVMEALAANNITALEYEISVLTIGPSVSRFVPEPI